MRYAILALAVCLLVTLAASTARAEETGPVGLGERAFDSTRGIEGDTAWVPVQGTTYASMAGTPYRDAPRKDWRFTFAAYLWASDISGTSYADGVPSDMDVAFSDLFDNLEYAFQGYAEVQYKRWSFAVDATFVGIKKTTPGPVAGILQSDFQLDQTTIDLNVGYTVLCRQVGKAQWGSCCHPRMMTVDALIGARNWILDTDLTISGPNRPLQNMSDSESWWDPYVGARWRWQFAKRWGLGVYADIGGFGIESASELTWKAQVLLRFHVTRGFFLGLGYRAIDVDRVEGSAGNQNGIDAAYHGPMLGLGIIF